LDHRGDDVNAVADGADGSSQADTVLLRCEHVSVRRGAREVLTDISMELHEGELVALLGPNGAGKSTLLDALSGSLPAASGRIERHGRIAVALQSGDLARRTAIANVIAALRWWGVPRPERIDAASAALSLLGAGHLADRQADSLSGGERRRVHLARAIAVRPDILMFDEPFAGVDVETRSALLEDSLSAIRSSARATLVVVHDRAEAWAMADRLLILLDGRLVASGAPERLLECPPTSAVARFLGFDGMLEDGEGVLLTRPPHVVIDPDGPLDARVVGAIPLEDGVRLALALDRGTVYAVAGRPAPSPGERVRLRLLGGARFPGR
jgi:ABC-type cobalamin/Fe3+-siderophores transport system ATPase subunit